eukprot:SAG31_NODE_1660_length_7599_cov_3.194800_2_plen_458_part_00
MSTALQRLLLLLLLGCVAHSQQQVPSCGSDADCRASVMQQIAALERQLLLLEGRIEAERRVSCMAPDSGHLLVEELGGGDGYHVTFRNETVDAAGLTRFDVFLPAADDAQIVLPGAVVRVHTVEDPDRAKFDIDIEGLVEDEGIVDSMIGTILAIPVICACLAITVALEAKFKCVGGNKIHHVVEEQRKISRGLHELLSMLGIGKHDEDDGVADSENPEGGENPLDNPMVAMLVEKALGRAGVRQHQTQVVAHVLKELYTSPAAMLDKLKQSGAVPSHIVEQAKERAARAASQAKVNTEQGVGHVRGAVDQAKTQAQTQAASAVSQTKSAVEQRISQAREAGAGAGAKKGNVRVDRQNLGALGEGGSEGKAGLTDVKVQVIPVKSTEGDGAECMTAPSSAPSRVRPKKWLSQARDTFKGGGATINVEISNPMNNNSPRSRRNPMTEAIIVKSEDSED